MKKAIAILAKGTLALILVSVAAVIGIALLAPGLHSSSLAMMFNVVAGSSSAVDRETLLQRLVVEEGYQLSLYASGFSKARMLRRSNNGDLLVSDPKAGTITALHDRDNDGNADAHSILLEGLGYPHGIELHGDYLYVAESNRVGRIRFDQHTGTTSGNYEVIINGLGDNGGHRSKSLRISDDGWLYLASGSSCNVCEEDDPARAAISRYRSDGSDGRLYATGLRNAVGLDFAHWNGQLYATDNGRDLLGDDFPPCELNRVTDQGFYGWPYLNGDNLPDPDFGELASTHAGSTIQSAIKPAFSFAAHNAPLGIHFTDVFGKSALVALHGSWNRSQPDGYKVVVLHWDDADNISSTDFVSGFEHRGNIVGRPVDIVDDGARGFFISDDYANVIYRVQPNHSRAPHTGYVLDLNASTPITKTAQRAADTSSTSATYAAEGQQLFEQYGCGGCHKAQSLPLVALQKKYDTEGIDQLLQYPPASMPAPSLTAAERLALANYLLATL